jgi:hypothetical protein
MTRSPFFNGHGDSSFDRRGLFAEVLQLHLGNNDPRTLIEHHARALPGLVVCVGSRSLEGGPAFSL